MKIHGSTPKPQGNSNPPKANRYLGLKHDFDEVTFNALPNTALILAGLYITFTLGHFALLPAQVAGTMMLISLSTAIGYLILFVVLKNVPIEVKWAHPLVGLFLIMALANSTTHMALLPRAYLSTNFILLIVGAGLILISFQWFILLVLVASLAWIAIAHSRLSPVWFHYGFAILTAIVLSFIVLLYRRNLYGNLFQGRNSLRVALEAMKEQQELIRCWSEASLEGMAILFQGSIVEVNNRLAEMFQHSKEELIKLELKDLITSDSLSVLNEHLEGEQTGPYELEGRRKDGSRFWMEVNERDLNYAQKRGKVAVVRDISTKKELENRLRKAGEDLNRKVQEQTEELRLANQRLLKSKEAAEQANRSKEEFINIASHELRTPLTPLRLLLQNSKRKLERGESIEIDVFVRMERQANRLTDMVNDLLSISRLERRTLALHKKMTDLRNLIAETVEDFRDQAPQRDITLDMPPQPLMVEIDANRFVQALANILDNAIKYTPADTPIEVRVAADERWAKISIKDYGPGVSLELEHVFSAFYRATSAIELAPGLGLGLFISNQILLLHGGRLEVESNWGRGSIFTILLPLQAAQE